jgi:putative addiction module killer protein
MFTITKTDHFDRWLRKLKDIRAKAKILTRLKRIEMGNLGDHKMLGGGVAELRIQYGPGYRVYFAMKQELLIVLLVGGDKSTQVQDFEKARAILGGLEGNDEN